MRRPTPRILFSSCLSSPTQRAKNPLHPRGCHPPGSVHHHCVPPATRRRRIAAYTPPAGSFSPPSVVVCVSIALCGGARWLTAALPRVNPLVQPVSPPLQHLQMHRINSRALLLSSLPLPSSPCPPAAASSPPLFLHRSVPVVCKLVYGAYFNNSKL